MKKLSYILIIFIAALGFQIVPGQKKTIPPQRKLRTIIPKVAPPKIETENWREFDAGNLNLKLLFPKTPSVSQNSYREFDFDVSSTTIQTFINSDYYLVEVREYPAGALPERTDLAESYGEWLKTYILARVKIVNERAVDFNRYKMIEFVYQQAGNEVLIHRAMVAGNRLYQLIVQYEIKKGETLEQTIEKNRGKIDKFFLAFELTGDEFVS